MIYQFKEIRMVHLEISSMCNAECPLCPRNFFGYPLNNGYKEHSMTLSEAKKIFSSEFLNQLNLITINGNFGDIVMCPDALDILNYFRQHNKELKILISTNGGARNINFWQELAILGCEVSFCIDGLEDTHSIYRRNTVYQTVLRNAKAFIDAGGKATWKFIIFDHNKHQIDTAKQLSKTLGFSNFELVDHGRNQGPVFNDKKELLYQLGQKKSNQNFEIVYDQWHTKNTTADDFPLPNPGPINCQVKKEKSVYINSLGEVYPCCWLGFNPKTFGKITPFEFANKQLRPLIDNNNALETDISQTVKWFDRIEESWSKPSYQEGLLMTCNKFCT